MMWSESKLRDEICLAFSCTTYPGDSNIFRSKYASDFSLGSPRPEIGLFLGKRWNQLDVAALLQDPIAATMLSAEGAAYFLPAIMLATLDEKSRIGMSDYFDEYIYGAFEGMSTPRDWEEVRERFRQLLTNKQRNVVARYIEFIISNPTDKRFPLEGAEAALNNEWANYLQDDV